MTPEARLALSPLTESALVCEAVVRYVMRSQQDLVLDDASQSPLLNRPPRRTPASVRSCACRLSPSIACTACSIWKTTSRRALSSRRCARPENVGGPAAVALERQTVRQPGGARRRTRTAELGSANARLEAKQLNANWWKKSYPKARSNFSPSCSCSRRRCFHQRC